MVRKKIGERLGAAGFVVAIVALVAALAGGAVAASGGGDSAQSSKVTQGKRGKPGKRGPTGPAGPQGPAGVNGKDGAVGPKGDKGDDGTPGAPGTSVTVSTVPTGGEEGQCVGVGGAKFVAGASKGFACTGKKGDEGSPWTLGGVVPPGKTLTGTWAVGKGGTGQGLQYAPIPFTLPVEPAPEVIFVWMTEGAFATPFVGAELVQLLEEADENGCPGFTGEGVPLADPGKLCVYANFMEQMSPSGTGLTPTKRPPGEAKQIYTGSGVIPPPGGSGTPVPGVNSVGTTLQLNCTASNCSAVGVWAVTAEE